MPDAFRLVAFATSVAAALFAPLDRISAQTSKPTAKPAAESAQPKPPTLDELLDLEKIFPEKGLFGPRPRGAAFSHDGRYVAWLHKPYTERRHGDDLWVHDFELKTTTRRTSPVVMAGFQADARKVLEQRLKKAKESTKKKGADDKTKDGDAEKESDLELMQRVGEKDADDEKAPRYGGVSSFEWSPTENVLLFTSGGDIYRLDPRAGTKPSRLTRTKDREGSIAWLPDGGGYTYMRSGGLFRVRFDAHMIEQLDPELAGGERLSRYELSPDGKRAVFVTSKGQGRMSGGRTVKIASYRDRFVKVREVPRHVSDDPKPKSTTKVYLYDLEKGIEEKGLLYEIHSHDFTGPRDTLRTPQWAPDSSRVTFAWFEQESDQVTILEAKFPTEEEQEKAEKKADEEATDEAGDAATAQAEDSDAEKREEENEQDPEAADVEELTNTKRVAQQPAKVVYRFLHAGGPNTPRMIDTHYLADSRGILFLSEQSGFRHLHVLDPVYESTRQLTSGRFEVYPFAMSEDHRTCYALATKEHPSRQDVYAVDCATGAMRRLTQEAGSYANAAVSPDGERVAATFTTEGHPRELVAVDGDAQSKLTDSHPAKAHTYTAAEPEFFSYENRHGHEIHGFLFKPADWQPSDERPAVVYVYGGPLGTRKQVTRGNFSADSYLFAWYMANKHGFVCATIDPRGMSGYGGVFEKANFEQVGKPQVEDLVDGVKYLAKEHGVDAERVGMHGWSFGGFQTQMCLYTEPDVFACGIAGAGPTEWENYNSWYSTGTIGKSRQGTKEPDLKKFSLLPLAKNLKSRLLLVHGMEDSNVLYQDTVRVYRELLKAGKETLVELFLDPTGGHGLGGDIKRLNRARKYEEFFTRVLGTGIAPKKSDGEERDATAADPAQIGGAGDH